MITVFAVIALCLLLIGYYLYSKEKPEEMHCELKANMYIESPTNIRKRSVRRMIKSVAQPQFTSVPYMVNQTSNSVAPSQTWSQLMENQVIQPMEHQVMIQKPLMIPITNQTEVKSKPEINIIYKAPNTMTPYEKSAIHDIWENYLKAGEPDMGLKDNSLVFLVYDNSQGRIIGMASILVLDEYDLSGHFSKFSGMALTQKSLILYNVCIHPDYRRQGIAQDLLGDIEAWAKSNGKEKIILFVKSKNLAAQRLYSGYGYQLDNNYKDHSGKPSDDIEYLMLKSLH